jgi:hypothetical protein
MAMSAELERRDEIDVGIGADLVNGAGDGNDGNDGRDVTGGCAVGGRGANGITLAGGGASRVGTEEGAP